MSERLTSEPGRTRPSRIARIVSSGLTLVSLALVVVWLYSRRHELATIQWARQWPIMLLLVGMYGFSLLLNFVVWHSCISLVTVIPWPLDLARYAYSNLSRRLPSGLGHFVVRVTRYSQDLDTPAVLYFSTQELLLQILTGALLASTLSIPTVKAGWIVLVLGALCALVAAFVINPALLAKLLHRISRGSITSAYPPISRKLVLGWLIAYSLTWINGGAMLFILLSSTAGSSAITFGQTLGLWAFTAALGLVGSIVPLGQFARDAALSLLLQAYIPLSVSVTIAIVFRFILTIGDVVWSLLLWVIGTLTQKRYLLDKERMLE